MKHILICGCSRSGNTLMSYLCAIGFNRVFRHPGEENPLAIDADSKKYDWVVSKRPKLVKKLAQLIEKNKTLHIIYMLRDPRDVIVSKHPKFDKKGVYYTSPKRWIASVEVLTGVPKINRLTIVRYEDLLKDPLKCQNLLSNRFGLVEAIPFTECHTKFKLIDKDGVESMHGARPFDQSRIGAWKSNPKDVRYVESALKKYPIIAELMNKYDYH